MAASGVGSKYHCALALLSSTGVLSGSFVGYMLRANGYAKSDSKLFAPRFGTGEQGLGDLDLYKTFEQHDFSGGGFQEYFDDPTRSTLVQFGLRNPVDKLLYPIPASTAPTAGNINVFGASTTQTYRNCWAVYKGVLYIATNGTGSVGSAGSGKGAVAAYNTNTHTFTNSKGDFADAILGMACVNGLLLVNGGTSGLWKYDGTTWTQVSSTWNGQKMKAFNGKIYVNGQYNTSSAGYLYSNDGAATSSSNVAGVGDTFVGFNDMEVYNHRLYIAKNDGLFAYDGVQVSTILDTTVLPEGVADLAVLNGSLYFLSSNRLYRFDGATVEIVQDFTTYETVASIDSAYGRLWVQTTATSQYSSKGSLGSNYNWNLYAYDGNGLFQYHQTVYGNSGTDTYGSMGVVYIGGQIIFLRGKLNAGNYTSQFLYWNTTDEYSTATTQVMTLITSQFDAGFPTMDKMAAAIRVQCENMNASDTCAVSMRFFDGLTWTAYIAMGNITSTVNRIDLVKAMQGTAGNIAFKRVQIQFVYTRAGGSSGTFKAFGFEYVLAPVLRRDWTLTLLLQGQSDAPLTLADNSVETNQPNYLRDFLYQCRANVPPLIFQDIDVTALTGSISNAVTTIPVGSTATFGFESGDLITIDSEIIQIGAVTTTSFTGCTRGLYGTAAASHSSGATVNSTFRVVLTKIQIERVIIPAIVDGVMNSYGNESELTLQLSEAK